MGMMVGRNLKSQPLTDVGEAVVDQVSDKRIDRPVERDPAGVPRGHELHPPQQRQLVTRHGQRQIHRSREVPDAELVVREGVHDAEPDGTGQDAKHVHGIRNRGRGGPTRAAGRHMRRADHSRQAMNGST